MRTANEDVCVRLVCMPKTRKFSMCSKRLWLICGCKNGRFVVFSFFFFFLYFLFRFVFGRTCARTTRWIKYHYEQQQQPHKQPNEL